MKKLMLLFAFVAMSAMFAHAQKEKKSPDQRAAHITKMLQKRLNLTAGQAQETNAIYLAQATKMDSLKSNQSPDKKLDRLTERTIMMSTHLQMMAILNDTQKQQYTEFENALKERKKAKKDTVGARP